MFRGAYEKINGSDDDRPACGRLVYNVYFRSEETYGIQKISSAGAEKRRKRNLL